MLDVQFAWIVQRKLYERQLRLLYKCIEYQQRKLPLQVLDILLERAGVDLRALNLHRQRQRGPTEAAAGGGRRNPHDDPFSTEERP